MLNRITIGNTPTYWAAYDKGSDIRWKVTDQSRSKMELQGRKLASASLMGHRRQQEWYRAMFRGCQRASYVP